MAVWCACVVWCVPRRLKCRSTYHVLTEQASQPEARLTIVPALPLLSPTAAGGGIAGSGTPRHRPWSSAPAGTTAPSPPSVLHAPLPPCAVASPREYDSPRGAGQGTPRGLGFSGGTPRAHEPQQRDPRSGKQLWAMAAVAVNSSSLSGAGAPLRAHPPAASPRGSMGMGVGMGMGMGMGPGSPMPMDSPRRGKPVRSGAVDPNPGPKAAWWLQTATVA